MARTQGWNIWQALHGWNIKEYQETSRNFKAFVGIQGTSSFAQDWISINESIVFT
jgi:hypothetical protein